MLKGLLVLVCLGASMAQGAEFNADFDSFSEGDFGTVFTDHSIVFHDLDRNLGAGDENFVIEDASTAGLTGSTLPNVMGIGGYLVGPNVAFGRFKSMEFNLAGPSYTMRSAALDFWTFNLHQAGNTVFLEGYLGGQLVDSDSFTPGSFVVAHKRLILPDDDYDRFVVRSSGPTDNGVVFANFDNVHITGEIVPEPASLVALSAGAGLLLARRRKPI